MKNKQAVRTGVVLIAAVVALGGFGCAGYDASVRGLAGTLVLQDESTRIAIHFSDGDRRYVHDYYASHRASRGGKKGRGHNPHGNFDELPPGIRKQVAQGKGLPPGLAKKRLPDDLERRLSPLPDGYVRFRIGTDLVIMNTKTNVVVDILSDI